MYTLFKQLKDFCALSQFVFIAQKMRLYQTLNILILHENFISLNLHSVSQKIFTRGKKRKQSIESKSRCFLLKHLWLHNRRYIIQQTLITPLHQDQFGFLSLIIQGEFNQSIFVYIITFLAEIYCFLWWKINSNKIQG